MKTFRFFPGPKMVAGISTLLFVLFFATISIAAEYTSVKKDGVNIRSGPDTKKEILWEVFRDFPLKVIKRQGKWSRIQDFEGDKGWIYTPLLAKEKTVIIKVKSANMRSGPGKNYEVIATVKYGVVFNFVKREGDWLQLKHEDGTTGWIFKTLLWPGDLK